MEIRDMAHSKPHSHAAKTEETTENLHGKWALITGASSGFGEEFARQYAAQGRPLVLVARRLEKLETLATELREIYRVDVIVEQADLSSVAAVIQLHQQLRERGIAIDILITNAGHGLQGTFVDGTLDAALAMLQLDVVSLTAVTHVFAQPRSIRVCITPPSEAIAAPQVWCRHCHASFPFAGATKGDTFTGAGQSYRRDLCRHIGYRPSSNRQPRMLVSQTDPFLHS
jgi:NAD(P)-dependent dehydrogenase (short-subunit alcohol dehydrogenase family)